MFGIDEWLMKLTKHDQIVRVAMEAGLLQTFWVQFNVATTAVDFLLVFDSELNDEGFAFV